MKLVINENINNALLEIITEADKELVIVSPFIKLDNLGDNWKIIVEKLREKSKIVEIHTRPEYYEKGERKANTVEELSKIFTGISSERVYFNKNLHAKLYFNGKKALIASSNLLKHSIENNIEIGYLIDDIEECKNIKEQFYEEYLIKPQKEVKKSIEAIEKNILNEKYDCLIYDNNYKITIKNKKHSETAFVLDCEYEITFDDMNYLLQFKITANDENTYSKIKQNFEKQFHGYIKGDNDVDCFIRGYKEDDNNKTITFSSDIIDTGIEQNAVFRYDDIRNVFCNGMLYNKFFNYINNIMIALRSILY